MSDFLFVVVRGRCTSPKCAFPPIGYLTRRIPDPVSGTTILCPSEHAIGLVSVIRGANRNGQPVWKLFLVACTHREHSLPTEKNSLAFLLHLQMQFPQRRLLTSDLICTRPFPPPHLTLTPSTPISTIYLLPPLPVLRLLLAVVAILCTPVLFSQTLLLPSTTATISSATRVASMPRPEPLLLRLLAASRIHWNAWRRRCRRPSGTGICRATPPPAAPR